MPGPRACFVSASGQNAYFAELLDALREALEQSGIFTRSPVDHFPTLRRDSVYVFVPHEYVGLGVGEGTAQGGLPVTARLDLRLGSGDLAQELFALA